MSRARKNQRDYLLHSIDAQVFRYFNYYACLGLNRFRWTNLPKGMESRHIEKALFEHGQAVFFRNTDKSKGYDLLCLPCQPSNALNVYGDPTHYNAFGVNEYFTQISSDDSIRILDNDMALAPVQHIRYYTYLMAQTELTINMNLDQQKFPNIIGATKKNELTMKNLYAKYSDFDPLLIVDEILANKLNSDGEGMKSINTETPFLLDKLVDFKKSCENELLTFLGVNNNNTDKKERLLTDEVNANNTFINMSLDFAFKERERACEKINEMFGLNIKVEKVVNMLDDNITLGGEPNEKTNGE